MVEKILVLNFGSQVAHLIVRRIRELGVLAELIPYNTTKNDIKFQNPRALVLSGGPKSVNAPDALPVSPDLFDLDIPILGICYGHQLLAKHLGGEVSSDLDEYGETTIKVRDTNGLLKGFSSKEITWMSHSDYVSRVPDKFKVTSVSRDGVIASMEHMHKNIMSVQFHPEVTHTKKGRVIFENFISKVKIKKSWRLENQKDELLKIIQEKVANANVLMAVSGGVDSTVAAKLIQLAIGDQLHCIFVNNGLLRLNEFEEVQKSYKQLRLNLHAVDASELFLNRLKGVTDPEQKRKIIGKTFIEVFEQKANELGSFTFLGQGTIYPDRVESAGTSLQTSVIKSHHNVGGLPERLQLFLLEPLKDLYKDEVRKIGSLLNIPENLLKRHPFPGPGLAIRIIGEVEQQKLDILAQCDHILIQELKSAGLYDDIWQAFVVLLDLKTVGVMGDQRTYNYPVVIRCVSSEDAMSASASIIDIEELKRIGSKIINEVQEVNRVFYDLTDKPPATIEFE